MPEAWAEIGNVFAAQPSLKFWGGSRFYRRQDIYINDFFFYNMSGSGGGFEDLELPFGKLALAWIGNGAAKRSLFLDIAALPDPNNLAGFSKQSFDLSLYDVSVPLGQSGIRRWWAPWKTAGRTPWPASAGFQRRGLHVHAHA